MHLRQPTRRNQSGFSAIEVLLAVLVVAGLAVTGLVVYQHDKQSSANSSAATSTTQTTQPKSTTTTQPAQTTATQYLTITEWGVRLALTSNTSSLYYYINPQIPNVAYLSLKTVSDIAPLCAPDKGGSLAAIGRLTLAEYQNTVNTSAFHLVDAVQIGNYWYGYQPSHANCIDNDTEAQAIAKVQPAYNLEGVFKTLEAVPPSVIKIPELSIQITVPDSIKDLRYKASTVTLRNGNQATFALFSTASLIALDSGCGTSFGPLGSLEKANGQYPSSDPLSAGDYGVLVKQFPTFYISAGWPQAGCSTNSTAQGLASTAKTEFGQAESTIQQLN